MADAVADRKKAKADYLAQLAKQKQQQQQQQQAPAENSSASSRPSADGAKNTREAVLEQRRRDFLEKKNSGGQTVPNSTTAHPMLDLGAVSKKNDLFLSPRGEPPVDSQRGGFDFEKAAEELRQQRSRAAVPEPVRNNIMAPSQPDTMSQHALPAPLASVTRGEPSGGSADRGEERTRQEEYARQLRQDEVIRLQQQQHQQHKGGYSDESNPLHGNGSGPFGLRTATSNSSTGSPSKHDQKANQRAKQEEYARLLQQDQQALGIAENSRSNAHGNNNNRMQGNQQNAIVGPGDSKAEERNKQRMRQEEYARLLQQDQKQTPSTFDRQNIVQQFQENHQQGMQAGVGIALGGNGHGDSKAAIRAKHDEYARQLQMDQQIAAAASTNQQQHRNNRNVSVQDQGSDMLSGVASNHAQDKAAARARQEAYARQLQQDQQYAAPTSSYGQPHQQGSNGHSNSRVAPQIGDDSQPSDRVLQRRRQEDYARQLQMDQLQHQQPNAAAGGAPSRHHNQQQNHNINAGGNSHAYGQQSSRIDDKAAQRARQEEYARQLQFDSQQKSVMAQGGSSAAALQLQRQNEYLNGLNPTGNASAAPDDGFVIGPLGLPVRRTLEVGNRGQQKAFNNQVLSPQKTNQMNGNRNAYAQQSSHPPPVQQQHDQQQYYQQQGQHGYVEENAFDTYTYPSQGGMPMMPPNALPQVNLSPNLFGAGSGGGNQPGAISDERELKAKQQKLEHARALEQQILDNKRRIEDEKRQLEDEELKLQQKIEEEQRQLALKFSEEKKKAAAEEERKNALAAQIEEKKQQKKLDEQLERDMEAKETEKARAGAEELARRERREIEIERGAVPAVDVHSNERMNTREQANNAHSYNTASAANENIGGRGNRNPPAALKLGLFDQPSPRQQGVSSPLSPRTQQHIRSAGGRGGSGRIGAIEPAPFEIVGEDLTGSDALADSAHRRNVFAPASPTSLRGDSQALDGGYASPKKAGAKKLSYNSGGANHRGGGSPVAMKSSVVVPLSPSQHRATGRGLFAQDDEDEDDSMGESLQQYRKAHKQTNSRGSTQGNNKTIDSSARNTGRDENDPLIKRFQHEAERAQKEALEAKRELDRMRQLLQEKEAQERIAQQDQQIQAERQQYKLLQEREQTQQQEAERRRHHRQVIGRAIEQEKETAAQETANRASPVEPFAGIFDNPLPNKPAASPAKRSDSDSNMHQAHNLARNNMQHSASLSDINAKTLRSESRFVFPDGSSFVPEGLAAESPGGLRTPDRHKQKPVLTLSPMKEDMAQKLTSMLDGDGADGDGIYGHAHHQPPAMPKIHLPPRNMIKQHTNDHDAGGRHLLDIGEEGQHHSHSRPSTVGNTLGAHRRGSRRGSRQLESDTPVGKPKRSVRKYINTDMSSSNENGVKFYNNDASGEGTTAHDAPVYSSSARQPHSSEEDFDIDGTLRKNKRKLNFLSKIGESSQAGMDELDLLLSMNEISSRPTTTASRPATMQGNSKFVSPNNGNILLPGFAPNRNPGNYMLDLVMGRDPGDDPYTRNPSRPSTSATNFAADETIGTQTIQRISKDFSGHLGKNGSSGFPHYESVSRPGSAAKERGHLEQVRQTIRSAGHEVLGSSMKFKMHGLPIADISSHPGRQSVSEHISPRTEIPVPIQGSRPAEPLMRESVTQRVVGSAHNTHRSANPADSYIDFSEFGL